MARSKQSKAQPKERQMFSSPEEAHEYYSRQTHQDIMRPKTPEELMAEWKCEDDACKLYEQSAQDYEEQAAQQRQLLEAARARRTAAAQAIQDRIGVAR